MIYVAATLIALLVIASLLYRPTTCFVCGGHMVNTAPGKVWCPDCGREGNV